MSDDTQDGVPFIGGPYDGEQIPRRTAAPAAVLVEGEDVPEGLAARYRYSTKQHGYVFKGFETVVLRIPQKEKP